MPDHVISAEDVPAKWAGRAIRCQRLNMLPIECIARGYLAGLGLDSYRASGTISGVPLPSGLAEGSRLPEPVFTPSTKATTGHDEFMTLAAAGRELGAGQPKNSGGSHWRSTAAALLSPPSAASSSPIPSSNLAGLPMAPWSWPTSCSRPTRRGSGPPKTGSRAGRSATSISSSSAIGRALSRAGTASRRDPRSRPGSWKPHRPATSKCTSGSPAPAGRNKPWPPMTRINLSSRCASCCRPAAPRSSPPMSARR